MMETDDMVHQKGQLLFNEPLIDYNTWRVGGAARSLYKPSSVNDLSLFLQQLPETESVVWLGLGSNALIPDEGVDATVILTQGALNDIRQTDHEHVYVEAGVSCAKMARFCARVGLSGAEFWAGIPGTMGGALRMNAGCANGETWNLIEWVETMNRKGDVRRRYPSEFSVSYRNVLGLNDEWFVAALCRLSAGDRDVALDRIKQLLAVRAATQPTGEYNCGSVFKNPPGDHAARLIESCGLKGYRIGGAVVSEKHANFIINHQGEASATDIKLLIQYVAKTVYDKTKVQLIPEVHVFGVGS